MKILIEAIGIEKPGGGRSATVNLLENIFLLDSENIYTVILSQHENFLDRFANVHQVIVPFHNRFLARIWAQMVIPIRFKNIDIIHFTKNLSVFGIKVPQIITIHDLTTIIFPQFFPWLDVFYWKTIEKFSVQRADLIIAVSRNTANDIVKYYGIEPRKVKVIYHGRSSIFSPASADEIANIHKKYDLPEKYLITVGRIDLKKNLTNLVKAFSIIQNQIDPNLKLVLVGEIYKKCEDKNLTPTIQDMGLMDKVIFAGRVPDADLPSLYSGAIACAFPSLHEGFGLVGLEAMACGVPIITHNSSAIVEVVGAAGVKVDATNVDELADALTRVINDESLRVQMKLSGLERSKEFDWKITARMTIESYQQVNTQ
ncbi:glycosyltransferase [Longilinea arvoryzae]|uniref:Glycosyltransferase n=1 Tax=Longilinea arvoryzae TaxID=360412 RepID=A0A0S7BHZ9_9CHLR|nr:glycosyltransferase family 1 protein [Longilinea arvoryzae]GAP13762.1 glycosyltransferase [Longilinea arvoryzae]